MLNNTQIQSPDNSQRSRKLLHNISLALLIDSIGYGLIFPILPQLFFDKHLGLALPTNISMPLLYSIALAAYPVAQFFGAAFFGSMSDRYGRKLLLLCGSGAIISSYVLCTIAVLEHSFILFLLSRFLSGFLGGDYSISNALVCDISGSNSEKRFNNFRLPVLANQLGAVIGPALAIFVMANSSFVSNTLIIPFCITASLAAINFCFLFHCFKQMPSEAFNQTLEKNAAFKFSEIFSGIYTVLRRRSTCLLTVAFFIYQCAGNLFMQGLSLYLTIDFNYHTKHLGLFFTTMSTIVILSTYSAKYFLKRGVNLIHLQIIFVFLVLFFSYADLSRIFHAHLVYSVVIRTWIIAGLFYAALPLIKLAFTTIYSGTISREETGFIMGTMGQISALSYITSAFFVGHAIMKHFILPIATGAFLLSLLCLFVYFIFLRKT